MNEAPVLSHFDPRLRLATTLLFAVLIVTVRSPFMLYGGLAWSICLYICGRHPKTKLWPLLLSLNGFLLFLLLTLPLSVPGQTLFSLGSLHWSREGFIKGVQILLRANAIFLAGRGLLGHLEPSHLGHAMHGIGIPGRFVHVFLFMVRYIHVLKREMMRLRDAMRVRCFRPRSDLHSLRTIGYLCGTLFLRSLIRSERILEAMKCRGFSDRLYILESFHWRGRDTGFLIVHAVVFALLVIGIQ